VIACVKDASHDSTWGYSYALAQSRDSTTHAVVSGTVSEVLLTEQLAPPSQLGERHYLSESGEPPSVVISEFKPTRQVPEGYPSGLPFLPSRHAYVTEYRSGDASSGARWQCRDPERVLALLAVASQEDGWVLTRGAGLPETSATTRVMLTRGNRVRRISVFRRRWGRYFVELVDLR
jgi:hypothetical protein